MKKLLAKGGIEFIAVFLGIFLSLWIDGKIKNIDLKLEKKKVYELLSKQIEELILYTDERIILYDRQISRGQLLINNWNEIGKMSLDDKNEFIADIWFSIKNAYYPDFSTYETLMGSGQINLVDFKTIKMFGTLYKTMDNIKSVQTKETEWRDYIENRLMIEHSDLFMKYDLPYDLLEFFEETKNDEVIYAHLKSLFSVHGARKTRIILMQKEMRAIKDHLASINSY
ncbi:MAG: hypothetical protein VW522_05555 [Candidatus Neomarinimicrobiota bacterium]